MKNFFKTFFASFLALIVFTILGVFVLIGIAASFSKDEALTIPANSVLVLDISQQFPEQAQDDPFTALMSKKKGKRQV